MILIQEQKIHVSGHIGTNYSKENKLKVTEEEIIVIDSTMIHQNPIFCVIVENNH